MKLLRGLGDSAAFAEAFARGCVLTIGNFDAVHIGHRAILRELTETAAARGVPSAVLTFDPHPQEFFAARAADKISPPRLTTTTARFFALAECGVDMMVSLKFNRALAATSAEDFVREYLRDRLRVRHLLIGDDFRFGARRGGDAELLQRMAGECGFSVAVCASVQRESRRVSSTWIRELLADGALSPAAQLLGRRYAYTGRVIYGRQRGRRWGFPTLNIAISRPPPLRGIFAVRVSGLRADAAEATDDGIPGVASLGRNPAISGGRARPILEAHLLETCGDAYGKRVCVAFCAKIRDEKNFGDTDALRAAIAADVRSARAYFATQN